MVTGSEYTFNKEYYATKVSEFGEESSLKRFFITKKAKTYLNKGYSVQEIRKLLEVTDTSLPEPDSQDIKDLITFHRIKGVGSKKKVSNTLNFATHKSDDSVAEFINNIKDYE